MDKFGHRGVCRFIKGYFEDTMPDFTEKVAAAYLDVDLASSTKTCLKYLYRLLSPRGVVMLQDRDFPHVIEVFDDERFWEEDVGCAKPRVDGLRIRKFLTIVKSN